VVAHRLTSPPERAGSGVPDCIWRHPGGSARDLCVGPDADARSDRLESTDSGSRESVAAADGDAHSGRHAPADRAADDPTSPDAPPHAAAHAPPHAAAHGQTDTRSDAGSERRQGQEAASALPIGRITAGSQQGHGYGHAAVRVEGRPWSPLDRDRDRPAARPRRRCGFRSAKAGGRRLARPPAARSPPRLNGHRRIWRRLR